MKVWRVPFCTRDDNDVGAASDCARDSCTRERTMEVTHACIASATHTSRWEGRFGVLWVHTHLLILHYL